jgi:HK97 family phage major capsid protein
MAQGMHKQFKAFTSKAKAVRSGQWLKGVSGDDVARAFCIANKISLEKAASEVPDSAGGFLTPTEMDDAILRVVESQGAFRQGSQVRTTKSDGQIRPRRTGGLTASFVNEGAVIPGSNFSADAVESAQKKVAILATASSELFEDSAPDLAEFVATETGYAFAGVEDDCGFNGDGTSTYRGISGLGAKLAGMKSAVAAAAGHDTFAEVDGTDLANLIAQVQASALPGSAWYTSAMGYALVFCRLAGTSGGLVSTIQPDGSIQASYLGFPVRFSSKLPDVATTLATRPMLYFGNLAKAAMIVERRQMVLAMSKQRLIDTDQILVRATQRMDILVHDVGDASTRGPIAMLVGTA